MRNNVRAKLIRTATVPISLEVLLNGQLEFLNTHYEVKGVSSNGVQLKKVAEREGIKTKGIDMGRGIRPFKDLLSLYRLYRYFKKEKPLIVHSITPKAGLLSMLAAKFARVPIRIHTFTGLIFPTEKGFKRQLLIQMDKILCWAATNVYPEGNGVKKDLINYKITKKPLKVLANGNVNGIDTQYFDSTLFVTKRNLLRQELNIPHDSFVFIFVGRLVGDKGINELVKAFQILNSESSIQKYKLLLVGPFEAALDPLSPETLYEIESNQNIISVGYQQDVRPYFAISDALVFPSYREGFPNVVMQAGAMGLPAIVTNINGCNEIIEEGKNGLIIPAKETNALYEKMQLIQSDPDLYNNLQKNARPMICDRYEQRVVWEALLAEYRALGS